MHARKGLKTLGLEQQSILLLVLEGGWKGTTFKEVCEKAEEYKLGFFFSEVMQRLKELRAFGLVHCAVLSNHIREMHYYALEMA